MSNEKWIESPLKPGWFISNRGRVRTGAMTGRCLRLYYNDFACCWEYRDRYGQGYSIEDLMSHSWPGYRYDIEELLATEPKKRRRTGPIICEETGEVFDSVAQIAEWLECSPSNVHNHLLKQQPSVRGYHFERLF